MRFRRLTTPFSRPPTSRRKITWATSGAPGGPGTAMASLTTSGPACIFQAQRDRRQHRSREFAQSFPGGVWLRIDIRDVQDDESAVVTTAGQDCEGLPELPPVGIHALLAVDPVPVPDEQIARCAGQA